MLAAAKGRVEVIKILVSQKGIDLDRQAGYSRRSALYLASLFNHVQVVKLFLDAGADPTLAARDVLEEGRVITPLDVAREKGHVECIQLLEVRCLLSVSFLLSFFIFASLEDMFHLLSLLPTPISLYALSLYRLP